MVESGIILIFVEVPHSSGTNMNSVDNITYRLIITAEFQLLLHDKQHSHSASLVSIADFFPQDIVDVRCFQW